MKTKLFGKTGRDVSAIGIGTWTMSNMWGASDENEAVRALQKAMDLGVNFIDTAQVYGHGHSERLIGRAIKGRSKTPFIATKVPPQNARWPGRGSDAVTVTFPAEQIIANTEYSLKNLGVDCLDLQQLHVWHDNWLGQGDYLEAIAKLKESGKVRHFGVSVNDHAPETALKIVASGLIDSVQVIYNIFAEEAEKELFPLCQKQGVAVIARVPLDEGSLAGGLTPTTVFGKKDWRRYYFTPERLPEVCQHIEALRSLVPVGWTLPQLALKFCISHLAVSTVIPGMKSERHVEENIAVADLPELSAETVAALKKQTWIRNFYPVWE